MPKLLMMERTFTFWIVLICCIALCASAPARKKQPNRTPKPQPATVHTSTEPANTVKKTFKPIPSTLPNNTATSLDTPTSADEPKTLAGETTKKETASLEQTPHLLAAKLKPNDSKRTQKRETSPTGDTNTEPESAPPSSTTENAVQSTNSSSTGAVIKPIPSPSGNKTNSSALAKEEIATEVPAETPELETVIYTELTTQALERTTNQPKIPSEPPPQTPTTKPLKVPAGETTTPTKPVSSVKPPPPTTTKPPTTNPATQKPTTTTKQTTTQKITVKSPTTVSTTKLKLTTRNPTTTLPPDPKPKTSNPDPTQSKPGPTPKSASPKTGPTRARSITPSPHQTQDPPDPVETDNWHKLKNLGMNTGFASKVMLPIALGIMGAVFIVCAVKGIRSCSRKNRQRRNRRNQLDDLTGMDQVMLLADDSEDEF